MRLQYGYEKNAICRNLSPMDSLGPASTAANYNEGIGEGAKCTLKLLHSRYYFHIDSNMNWASL